MADGDDGDDGDGDNNKVTTMTSYWALTVPTVLLSVTRIMLRILRTTSELSTVPGEECYRQETEAQRSYS